MLLRRFASNWIARAGAAISLCLLTAPVLLAADEPVDTGQSYTMSYMLTILICALGIMIVARSAHRTTEVKPIDED